MLDKRCKIILNTLIKNGFTYPQAKFVNISETLIPLLPTYEKIEWTLENLTPLLQYLHKLGYVDYVERTRGYYPVLDCTMLYTTYPGTHYKLFALLRLRDFFLTSFVIPAMVAVIAALLAG